jgi:hypothetical protein
MVLADNADTDAFVDDYTVTWDSPGKDYQDSMPMGNGDIVFLISKTDAWTENGQLVKLGRVRIKLDPSPFAQGSTFHQILKPRLGEIEITGDHDTILRAWVDANAPVIHLDVNGSTPVTMQASVELWRTEPRKEGLYEFQGSPVPIVVDSDTVPPAQDNALAWYHSNSRSIYPGIFQNQHLESLLPKYPDPLLHRCFGIIMKGTGLVSTDNQTLKSDNPQATARLDLYALTD